MKTRELILSKSFQLFLSKGYKEISINNIIGECGISKGAFYHHFKSKEELYQEVLNRFFFDYFQDADFIYDTEVSFKEKLQHFVNSFLSPYDELLKITARNDLIPYFRFLFQAAANNKGIKYKVNKHFYKKAFYLAQILQDEKKNFKTDLSIKPIAGQLLAIILGITILDGINNASDIKSNLNESIEVYLKLLIETDEKN
jgi:AcrR family transcriptional regulator